MGTAFRPAAAGADPAEIYAHSAPSVFSLTAIGTDGERSTASAFSVGERLVATSYHAVAGASRILLRSIATGDVVGRVTLDATDSANDVALLRVAGTAAPPIALRAARPAIGEAVLAIGSPQGLEGSLSNGLVAGFRRISGKALIQITAPVAPGNSGGPVLDAEGRVVGMVHARTGTHAGIGFATPAAQIAALMAGTVAGGGGGEEPGTYARDVSARAGDRMASTRSLDAWRDPPAARPRRGNAIAIGIADWDSAEATAYILAEAIRRFEGAETRFVEGSLDRLFAEMEAGTVDVIADIWLPNHQALVERFVDTRGTARLSGLLYAAIQGLCVPRYTAETLGLRRVEQLRDRGVAARFDRDGDGRGEIWIGQAGWQSANIERLKARDYGHAAGFDLLLGEEAREWEAVLDALTLRRHRVFYCYAPHWITSRSDIVLLDEPAHEADCFRFVRPEDDPEWFRRSTVRCQAPREAVHIAVRAALETADPGLYAMLTQAIQLPVGAVQDWLRAVKQQRRDPREYTDRWISRHEPLVREWMEAGLQVD